MKIAVFGTGSAGTHHLNALQNLDGIEPIAVPIRLSRLPELEATGYRTASDIREAITNGADAAIIATDTLRHAQDAMTVLQSGLDVLVEKPLSINAQEARQICDVAERMQRKIFVACVLRFSEALSNFRQILLQIGPLHSVRIEAVSYLPHWRPNRPYQDSYSARANEGGVLLDLIHEIDYAGWIFGWPCSLQAKLRNLGRLGIASEETADLVWETQSGCSISVCLDYLSQPPRRSIIACGSSGTAELNFIDQSVKVTVANKVNEELFAQAVANMFSEQDRAFINAIQGEADPKLATGGDGVSSMAVCDTARLASASRREEIVVYP